MPKPVRPLSPDPAIAAALAQAVSPPIVLVGARSRAGRAIRARMGMRQIISVARSPGQASIQVRGYDEIPVSALRRGAVVVNCVGAVSGSERTLTQANVEIPLRWATAARSAGAAHFVQLSSFSVYGDAEDIDSTTQERPKTPYGATKLAGDRALTALDSDEFGVTILRVPMLFGGGGPDKMTRLARTLARLKLVPDQKPPVERSMLTYGGLACVIEAIVSSRPRGTVLAADPQLFTYDLLRGLLLESGARARPLRIPRLFLALAGFAVPSLHARLFASSRLDPSANFANALLPSGGLRNAIAESIRGPAMES